MGIALLGFSLSEEIRPGWGFNPARFEFYEKKKKKLHLNVL